MSTNINNSINSLPCTSSNSRTPPSAPSTSTLINPSCSPALPFQSATPPSVHQNPPPSSERISEITSSWFQNGNNVVGNEIETSLRNWENENAPGEDRQIAAQRIRGFLNNTSQSSLDLSNLSLSTLPSIFNSDPFVTRLTKLDVSLNRLEALPEAIGELRALQRLDVGFNQLTALPEAIGRLQALQRLDVFNNQLRALPEAIGGLQELKILALRHNISLTGVPNEMLSLPSTCIIGLEQTGLSEAVRTRLRDICGSPNYHGPMISFSMVHAELPVSSERSAEELLSELCSLSGSAPKDFHNLFASDANKNNLRMWLARLSYAADYRKGGEFQKAFARKVLHYLHVAEENEQFRETFFNTIAGAAETCGDRVALSILHLGIACKLATIDTKDIKQLENFLIHTVLPIELLEKIARDKIPALHFYDEIEVYLGYPVMLRERLKMEIDVDEMLYFRCSALQQTDLNCAAKDVLRTQKDDEESCLFLVKNDRWIDSLKANYPDKFAKTEDEISNEEESCTSESDDVNPRNLREEKLIDLTAWARGQF